MKKWMYSIGMLLIGILLFILAIKYIGLDAIVNQFKTIRPRDLFSYLLISISIVTVLVIKWKLILHAQGYDIPFHNLFMYRQMGYAVGYIIPSFYIGGETMRVFFLRKHKVPLTQAVSSVIIDRAVELPLNFLMACVMFFLVVHTLTLPKIVLLFFAAALVLILIIGTLFYYKIFQKEYFLTPLFDLLGLNKYPGLKQLRQKIREVETSLIRFFNKKIKFFMLSIAISAILWGLMILEFHTALSLVGFKATLAQIYLVVTMTGFAMLFPIPASIGILELSQIGIAILVGIPVQVAVALSILVRTRDFMWIFLGILFYLYHGTSYVKALLTDLSNGKSN
ncbi:MAG: lysylphosphatidylglycerol synthase transmembrane domain-containing protein [Candidatus Woesearchaeota archaeon]